MVSVQAIFGDVLLEERLKGLRWSLCANAETGFELDVLLMGADLDALHSLCEFAYDQGLWGLVDRGGVQFPAGSSPSV